MLTTNLRTHYVILQDGRQFPITLEQYANIRDLKTTEKATSFFALTDADTGTILFDGELRAVKEFKVITSKKSDVVGFYCGYGNTHPLDGECECFKKYNVPEFKFRDKAYELLGKFEMVDKIIDGKEVVKKHYYPLYMQDISYQDRNKIVELCA